MGSKLVIDNQVDGLNPCAHHNRQHENQNLPYAFIPETKIWAVEIPFFHHRRNLDDGLHCPTNEEGHCQTIYTKTVIPENIIQDDHGVRSHAQSRRHVKFIQRLQNPHERKGNACKENGGEHHMGQLCRQCRRFVVIACRKKPYKLAGENLAYHRHEQCHQPHKGDKTVRKSKCLFLPFFLQIFIEYGNEAGGYCRSEYRIKKGSRHQAGCGECLRRHAVAVIGCQKLISHQPQHFSHQSNKHHKADRFHGAVFFLSRHFVSPEVSLISLFLSPKHKERWIENIYPPYTTVFLLILQETWGKFKKLLLFSHCFS